MYSLTTSMLTMGMNFIPAATDGYTLQNKSYISSSYRFSPISNCSNVFFSFFNSFLSLENASGTFFSHFCITSNAESKYVLGSRLSSPAANKASCNATKNDWLISLELLFIRTGSVLIFDSTTSFAKAPTSGSTDPILSQSSFCIFFASLFVYSPEEYTSIEVNAVRTRSKCDFPRP